MQRKVDSKFLCHTIGYLQVNLQFLKKSPKAELLEMFNAKGIKTKLKNFFLIMRKVNDGTSISMYTLHSPSEILLSI